MSTIGSRLREERERLGLSQTSFGALAAVQKGTQINYEGDKRIPDAAYLGALVAHGVDVLYVVTGRPAQPGQRVGAGEPADPWTGPGPQLTPPPPKWGKTPRRKQATTATVVKTEQVMPAYRSDIATATNLMGPHEGSAGFLMAAVAHLAASRGTDAWKARPAPATSDTPQAGGMASHPHEVGALLPHTGAKAVRPLVLSVPLGERGEPDQTIDYQVIPKHLRLAAAGRLADATTNEPPDVLDLAGEMAFTPEWLRHNMGHTTGALATVRVHGDSMASTLLEGDTIMIDEGVTSVDVDGIYVIELYGRRLVKRVQHLVNGTLVLISDNPAYQRQELLRDTARDVRVLGRMVWPRVR